ncbi:hypothetical protein BC833DRAFT_592737 [Globomyces pollinis-pini]|nr:hypothetical protein BC833DRAFT_592737 [Globomyces pollinis-pini]
MIHDRMMGHTYQKADLEITKDYSVNYSESSAYVSNTSTTNLDKHTPPYDASVQSLLDVDPSNTPLAESSVGTQDIFADMESVEVKGPDGQLCQNQTVLDQILSRYIHINSNQYKGGATGKIRSEYMICDCRYNSQVDDPNMACGIDSGCINRELSIECPENDCPCGPYCQNKRFTLKQYAPIRIFRTQKKGFGLQCKKDLKKGSFIIEYCGEILSTTIFKKRIQEYSKKKAQHFYFMSLKSQEYIDASKKGNISRFMNHSCLPNCELQKWVVGPHMRIGIFAKIDIPAGTELTFDYKFERYGAQAQPCYCGESICTGFIGKDIANGTSAAIEGLEEELSSEEEDAPDTDMQKQKVVDKTKGLSSIEQVQELIKYLMMNCGNPSKVLRTLNRLLKTDTLSLLRKFIGYKGITLLEKCLNIHIKTKSIVKHHILLVLKNLPISTRNPIVTLEPLVKQLVDAEMFGHETSILAEQILENWAGLELVYVIPKRAKQETSPQKSSHFRDDYERSGYSMDHHRFDPRQDRDYSRNESAHYLTHSRSHDRSFELRDDKSFHRNGHLESGMNRTVKDHLKTLSVNELAPELTPSLSWNTFIPAPLPKHRSNSPDAVTTPSVAEVLSEDKMQQMIEAAQEATRLAKEAALKKQQKEIENMKRKKEIQKQKHQEKKQKLRQISAMHNEPKEATQAKGSPSKNLSDSPTKVITKTKSQSLSKEETELKHTIKPIVNYFLECPNT